jgi:hypothetical protein
MVTASGRTPVSVSPSTWSSVRSAPVSRRASGPVAWSACCAPGRLSHPPRGCGKSRFAMLTSFHARGFRVFEDLKVPRVGRVNLIVGRNNVGKTMLLHALRVFQSQGSPDAIFDLLRDRDEFPRAADETQLLGHQQVNFGEPLDIAALFHGRAPRRSVDSSIILAGGGMTPGKLEISIGDDPTREVPTDEARRNRHLLGGGSHTYLNIMLDEEPLHSVAMDDGFVVYPVRRVRSRRVGFARGDELIAPLLASGTVDAELLAAWWDRLSLTDAEEQVIGCLQLISPIERIALVDHPFSRSRVPLVKLAGLPNPIPLRALGDGVSRMFAVALAMEIARSSKLLLIDEIENGIHYSVLPAFWRFVFEAAAQRDVQVFATSHSWDCIEAFQQAAGDNLGAGALIKLARTDDHVTSTVFDDDELRIATRDGIELR